MLDLELQHQQQDENLIISLVGAYDNLRAQIDIWEQSLFIDSSHEWNLCIYKILEWKSECYVG